MLIYYYKVNAFDIWYNYRGEIKMQNHIEYVLKDQKRRDFVLILPGGGYERTSQREAMPVANECLKHGMHAAIFWYREEKLTYPTIHEQAYKFLLELRHKPFIKRLFIIGFSAGGHFALMLSIKYPQIIDKTVLGYPVISTDPLIWHESSFKKLLGSIHSPYLDEVSLENHIHSHMKPVFVMHTQDDQSVPVENSLNLIQSLQKHHIYYEAHIYPKGRHGISLATKEVAFDDVEPNQFEKENTMLRPWFKHAINFMRRTDI